MNPNRYIDAKVDFIKLHEIHLEWHRSDKIERFGQYFYNQYVFNGPWPELFYQKDSNQEMKLIYETLGF